MKRRIKLLSSIFSLTLAFAFMATGIYASATRTATVSGTLSFTASSLDATITVKYKDASATTHPTTAAVGDYTLSPTTGSNATNGVITFTTGGSFTTASITIPAFAFTDTKLYAGFYVSVSAPASTVGVKVAGLSVTTTSFDSHFTLDQSKTVGTLGTDGLLSAGGTYTKFFNFTLKDAKNLASTTADLTYSLTVNLERAS